jgi:hypothetical protein
MSWQPSDCLSSNMENPAKRWVPPKEGIKAGWAKFEGWPDFVVGSSDSKADTNLMHYHLAMEKVQYNPLNDKYEIKKCLLQELHERGW